VEKQDVSSEDTVKVDDSIDLAALMGQLKGMSKKE
jgi:hypothetical protein